MMMHRLNKGPRKNGLSARIKSKMDLYSRNNLQAYEGNPEEMLRKLRQEVGINILFFKMICKNPNPSDNGLIRTIETRFKQAREDLERMEELLLELNPESKSQSSPYQTHRLLNSSSPIRLVKTSSIEGYSESKMEGFNSPNKPSLIHLQNNVPADMENMSPRKLKKEGTLGEGGFTTTMANLNWGNKLRLKYQFFLEDFLGMSIMLLFCRAVYQFEYHQNSSTAVRLLRKALGFSLQLSKDSTHPMHPNNQERIRLYLAKIFITQGNYSDARKLLNDNLNDFQRDLCIRSLKANQENSLDSKALKSLKFLCINMLLMEGLFAQEKNFIKANECLSFIDGILRDSFNNYDTFAQHLNRYSTNKRAIYEMMTNEYFDIQSALKKSDRFGYFDEDYRFADKEEEKQEKARLQAPLQVQYDPERDFRKKKMYEPVLPIKMKYAVLSEARDYDLIRSSKMQKAMFKVQTMSKLKGSHGSTSFLTPFKNDEETNRTLLSKHKSDSKINPKKFILNSEESFRGTEDISPRYQLPSETNLYKRPISAVSTKATKSYFGSEATAQKSHQETDEPSEGFLLRTKRAKPSRPKSAASKPFNSSYQPHVVTTNEYWAKPSKESAAKEKIILDELMGDFMMPRGLKQVYAKKNQSHVQGYLDCDGYFDDLIINKVSEEEKTNLKNFQELRKKCLLAHNKIQFDKDEVTFSKGLLEAKHKNNFSPDQPIPDEQISKYFENEKKITLRRLKIEEEKRKENEKQKRMETQKQLEAKNKLLEVENYETITDPKVIHRDKILHMMYKNPEVFRVNTIVQTINRLKRESEAHESEFMIPSSFQKVFMNKTQKNSALDIATKGIGRAMNELQDQIKASSGGVSLSSATNKKKKFNHSQGNISNLSGNAGGFRSSRKHNCSYQKGLLEKHPGKLAQTTRGLHLKSLKSKKISGGIYEFIKFKQQLDKLEEENKA